MKIVSDSKPKIAKIIAEYNEKIIGDAKVKIKKRTLNLKIIFPNKNIMINPVSDINELTITNTTSVILNKENLISLFFVVLIK